MKILFSDRVLRQLDRIHSYIAQENWKAADSEITRILSLIENQLATFPLMGRTGGRKGTREFPILPYLIVYRVKDNSLTVVSVLHGNR